MVAPMTAGKPIASTTKAIAKASIMTVSPLFLREKAQSINGWQHASASPRAM
jgi:hypothetical protein